MDTITRNVSVLGSVDYVVFAALLLFSTCIGLFFAYFDSKKKSKESDFDESGYLVGNRSMSAGPVALSLTASFMSSITVISTPAEIYYYGAMFMWFFVSYVLVAIIVNFLYMPFFYRQGYTSTYQYIEERFGRPFKLLLCIIYTFNTIVYAGIVIYAPALAINKVCAINMNAAILVMGIVCCIYTSLGGIKAVIWTDVVQYLAMYAGFMAIIGKGAVDFNGLGPIVEIAREYGRMSPSDFSPDLRVRHSVWSCVLGGTFGLWLGVYGVNQSNVQRYISCKSAREASKAVWINCGALILINFTACASGLVMFAYYHGCDPLEAGWITARDQLVPYMVLDQFQQYPGLPGLFLASACSGTLSTVSSGINSVCAILIEELKDTFKLAAKHPFLSARAIVCASGMAATGVAFICMQLSGTVLQASMSINGIVAGPTLGLFTLGMLCPWVSSRSAGIGFLSGLGTGVMLYSMSNPTDQFTKILSVETDRCQNGSLALTTPPPTTLVSDDEIPFQISYIYLSTAGLLVTMILSNLASFIIKKPDPQQRKKALFSSLIWDAPWAQKYFPDDDSLQSDEKQLFTVGE